MTNSFIKRGILVFSMVLLAMAGCKKDKDSASFTVTGPTSMYFEYGQEKTTAYKSSDIVKYETTVPEGWTCTLSKGIITVTAPAAGSGGDDSGSIKITATSTTSTEITQTLTVSVKPAEALDGHANSYIVAQPGQRYKFDARVKGNESAGSMTPDDAVLVWSSVDGAVGHVSLEEGYLCFATADGTALTEANAVVAALDKDDKVLWSWHIWVTGYDPAAGYDILGGEKVMSRNLGAMASSNASTDDVLKSYGLYYQWGRKDPFPGPNAWASTSQLNIYNDKSKFVTITYKVTDSEVGTVDYATAHPATFIAGKKDTNYDWLFKTRDNSLWGDAKTVSDPCPAGWKVAPATIWEGFTTDGESSETAADFNVDGAYSYGWTFRSDETVPVYWPAAGRRSFSNNLASDRQNFTNIVNGEFEEPGATAQPVGFYWSSTAATASESSLLAFRYDYVNPGADTYTNLNVADDAEAWSPEGARAGGFPLRCVRE